MTSDLPEDGPDSTPGRERTLGSDFEWPPSDQLSVHLIGPELLSHPHEASAEDVAGSHEPSSRTPPHNQAPRARGRRSSVVLSALILAAVVAAWALHRRSALVPAEAGHRASSTTAAAPSAPAADGNSPTAGRPPDTVIIVTYPVDTRATATAPAASIQPDADAREAVADAIAVPSTEATGSIVAAAPTLPTAVSPGLEHLTSSALDPSGLATPTVTAPSAKIRALLQRYESAYDRGDVRMAAELWPSLDRRALARAFSSLSRQDVDFEQCQIDTSDDRGSAVCIGTVRYVPNVGRAVEKQGRITWTFDLVRSGDDWTIARLTSR